MSPVQTDALPSAPARTPFSSEIDGVDATQWSGILGGFADASIYQTWAYGAERGGDAGLSHLLLKRNSEVLAGVQARITQIPRLNLGVAYIFWGPLWKRRQMDADVEVFRQALRAVKEEYVGRRKLVARIVSPLCEPPEGPLQRVFEEEGYVFRHRIKQRRTILVDLRPSLEELHQGLHQKWRYHLNKARKKNLEIIEGTEAGLFDGFARIYAEMLDRKQFDTDADMNQYRRIQDALATGEKMRVFLCKAEGEICAGGIVSSLGEMAIYLFGATNDRGIKNYGSYLIHWRMLEWAKQQGCPSYDLNGINPDKNPGGYQFKTQLAGTHGREVSLLGHFDAYPNASVKWLTTVGDWVRAKMPNGRKHLARFSR